MLFFADSGEGAATQAVLMGSVAIVVVSMLLLICVPRQPIPEGESAAFGRIAMERTLRIVDEALAGRRRSTFGCPATLAGIPSHERRAQA